MDNSLVRETRATVNGKPVIRLDVAWRIQDGPLMQSGIDFSHESGREVALNVLEQEIVAAGGAPVPFPVVGLK